MERLFKGFLVGYEITKVSHLQYADDTSIFMVGDPKYGRILKYLIRCFKSLSGLSVNWSKSHLLGLLLSHAGCIQMASSLSCASKDWPIEYLGLPLGGMPTRRGF